jgi:hypothetical protein
MSTDKIFEQASRQGLLIPSVIGNITVTDLWELPIRTTRTNKASLENVGNSLLQAQKDMGEASILGSLIANPKQTKLNLQLAIVRHVINVRTAENAAKTSAAATRSQREKLDAIIEARTATETPLDQLIAQRDALPG